MIHEVYEVQELLIGNGINKKCLYRMCYLLAKWHKQRGLSRIEIREAIFEWAGKYKLHIEHNLNGIIYQAMEDTVPLRGDVEVWISPQEAAEIRRRFDTKNTCLTALAVLCLAKVSGDEKQTFPLAMNELSHWTGIAASSLSGRIMTELSDFGYIQKVEAEQQFTWNEKAKSRKNRYQLLVPIEDTGKHRLVKNDLHTLYQEIFPGCGPAPG